MKQKSKYKHPFVLMVMKPVDGGRAVIGMIECPFCGCDHFTTKIKCGKLDVFCGSSGVENNISGWHVVDVQQII